MSLQRIAPQAGTVGPSGPSGPTGPSGLSGPNGTGPAFYSQTAAPTGAVNGDLWFKTDAPSQNAVHPFLLMGA